MDENKKINLPKTSFSMKANLTQKEPMQLKEWEKLGLYNKILEKNRNNQKYILHDGPPYANGNIHLGHALNKILKDIIIKYESMNGKYSPYVPGWDCHGLPIEFKLLKEMGMDKNQVDQIKFRRKAADYAMKHVKLQREEFKRLGVFGDWDNPYLTLDPKYEAVIIKVFRELVSQGYIYRGMKPVYWCTSCETALAESEVEYGDHTSTSVYVKFPILKSNVIDEAAAVVIWTTTPWTLPSNVALAFHPDNDYALINVTASDNKNINVDEKLIIAKELLAKVCEVAKIKYEILKTLKGKDLEGIECSSPYRKESSVGVLADYVTLEDGTGVVHIAPGHGQDDYLVGLKYNLPIINPVDDSGKFTKAVEKFVGMHVFKANPLVVADLDARGILVASHDINHSYPKCWRCKSPLVFRATNQWFLDVNKDGLRERMLDVCKQVNWLPEYGLKRISGMIENRPDWCLSRQRLWGTPIPVFYCKDCGEPLLDPKVIEAIEKIFAEKGSDQWFIREPKDMIPENTECKCGSTEFKKETDILDVWFDSGVSHEVVLKGREGFSWPADLYLEGSDQHRGWFQTSLIPSVSLYDKAPYKEVLTHGFIVEADGKKMSKSTGNAMAPKEIVDKYGADVLRLWVASENYREDIRISDEIFGHIVDAYRKIRNTVRYMLGNLDGYEHSQDEVNHKDLLEIDRWALTSLAVSIKNINDVYERREFHNVYRYFYNFCTVTLSSIYFDILKDRLYVSAPKSIERKSAQTVLYYLSTYLTRVIAPIMSYTSEEIWKNLSMNNKAESIFLEDFPKIENNMDTLGVWIKDLALLEKWNKIFAVRSLALKKIEEKRLEKVLGNSLEAKVKMYIDKEYRDLDLTKDKNNFWETVFIVSQVDICIDENVENLDEAGIKIRIEVEKAEGQKCSRCWNFRDSVGKNSEYPDLCERCVEAVKNWDK